MTLVELVLRILGQGPGKGEMQPGDRAAPGPIPQVERERAFETILDFTLEMEGGLSNNPADPGGRTIYGISERAHPELWKDGPPSLETAKRYYRTHYWDRIHGDELPPRTAMALFDFTVHSGEGVAGKALQRLVKTAVDGDVGPRTVKAAAAAAPDTRADRELAFQLLRDRGLFLGRWIAAKAARAQFAPGFLRRLVELGALLARY